MRWILFAIVGIALTVAVAAYVSRPAPAVLDETPGGEGTATDLNMDRIREDIRVLSGFESRMTGYSGSDQAADHILRQLERMGAGEVEVQPFEVAVPIEGESYMTVPTPGGTLRIRLYAVWPNLAVTSQTPSAGITGPLVDAGQGTEEDLRGLPIRDSIVVLSWSSNRQWLDVAEFGVRAVVFQGDGKGTHFTAQNKYLTVPANIPRYYVRQEDAAQLSSVLKGDTPRQATIHGRMTWRRATARNILAQINDGEDTEPSSTPALPPIVFHAYYDSVSVVPGLAPGAEQACGAATLLELGRYFSDRQLHRSVYLLFTGGHGQALAGMTAFIDKLRAIRKQVNAGDSLGVAYSATGCHPADGGSGVHADDMPVTIGPSLFHRLGTPGLMVGLDLSSRSESFGVFCMGHSRRQLALELRSRFSTIGRVLNNYAQTFRSGMAPNGQPAQFQDCINLTLGRGWWTFFPYEVPFESEIPTLAQVPGITFATLNDGRESIDTPDDQYERMRLDLFERQITTEPGARPGLANMAQALVRWTGPFVSKSLPNGYAEIGGRVVWLDQRRNYMPNEPLADGIVFLKLHRRAKHLMGTRGIPAAITDDRGCFRFSGLAKSSQWAPYAQRDAANNKCLLEAYGTANDTFLDRNPQAVTAYEEAVGREAADVVRRSRDGRILFAGDMARPNEYPTLIKIDKDEQHLNLVCFPCQTLSVMGLTDPRGYVPLTDLTILDAATKSPPFQFGKSMPRLLNDPTENLATIWTSPRQRIQLMLGTGFGRYRLVLSNSGEDSPEGDGFLLNELATVPSTVLQGTRDMWHLDASRIRKLENNGVRHPRIKEAHVQAGDLIDDAEIALNKGHYRDYRIAVEKAWSLEAQAYGESLGTIHSMLHGVLFYLALLLPASYCLERLLIAANTIKGRIIGLFSTFSVGFLILVLVHPAFRFTLTPMLVLLAFVIVTLVVTVSVIIVSRMDGVLKARRQATSGRHEDTRSAGHVFARALDLGISNIRRRPQRGFLTGLTVVLVTFTLLSFTSMTPVVSISRLNHPDGTPVYRGMLARDRQWKPLPDQIYTSLSEQYRETHQADDVSAPPSRAAVAARAWFFSDQSGNLSQIDLVPVLAQDESPTTGGPGIFTAEALLCLESVEPAVTGVDRTLVAGRWFEDNDEEGVILSRHVAGLLGFGTDAVGRHVRIFGKEIPLIGLFDAAAFDRLTDLDGEPLTPTNLSLQLSVNAHGYGKMADTDEAYETLEEAIHFRSDQIAIVPFKLGWQLGARIRSVAVKPPPNVNVTGEAEGFTRRSNLTILASDGRDEVTLFAALNTSQISAAWQIVVPIILGFVLVLGTMMGSVFERQREIFVYGSVGLSPNNVGSLFLAESLVYALIGAGVGYLLGQGVTKVLQGTGIISGLSFNYTAGSAVLVSMLTMAIVLISTVYPAYRAYTSALPDEGGPASGSDADAENEAAAGRLNLFLPFVVTPHHIMATQAYMSEYLQNLSDVTVGNLAVDDLRPKLEHSSGQPAPVLMFRAWLAPFDLGVSHDVQLRVVWRENRQVFQYHLSAVRFSGDNRAWRRLLPPFIQTMRKQLLMWRVLSPDEQEEYRRRGTTIFGVNEQIEHA